MKNNTGNKFWDTIKSSLDHDESQISEKVGMRILREMFPEAKANELNFVLFSTSGKGGTSQTIEEVEAGDAEGSERKVRFLIIHPRKVILRHGNCIPESPEDFDFLKRLRQSSWDAVQKIGRAK